MKDELAKEGFGRSDILNLEMSVMNYTNFLITDRDNIIDITDIQFKTDKVINKEYFIIDMFVYCINNFFDQSEIYYEDIQVYEGPYWLGDIKLNPESKTYIFEPELDTLFGELFETEIGGHIFTEKEILENYVETDSGLLRLRKILKVIFEESDKMDDILDSAGMLYARRVYDQLKKTKYIRFNLPKKLF